MSAPDLPTPTRSDLERWRGMVQRHEIHLREHTDAEALAVVEAWLADVARGTEVAA